MKDGRVAMSALGGPRDSAAWPADDEVVGSLAGPGVAATQS
jgi:hypothetical protein